MSTVPPPTIKADMQKPKLLCIGHRGAMGHKPENTLASIYKALELGALYIEIDVQSVAGHLLVFHDTRLERTTNGSGYLRERPFDYIRSLDAGGGQKIPTLEEACAAVFSRACINIELKGTGTAAPVSELINELIRKGWNQDAILVSSFDHRELLKIKRHLQNIKLGALIYGVPVDHARFAEDLGAFSVHPALDFVDQRFIDDAHYRNLKVFVYTVNHPEDIARSHQLGADGVFTSFPERVLRDYAQGDISNGWN